MDFMQDVSPYPQVEGLVLYHRRTTNRPQCMNQCVDTVTNLTYKPDWRGYHVSLRYWWW